MFLVFVGLSFMLWVLKRLNNTFTHQASYPIVLTHMPEGTKPRTKTNDTIFITTRMSGSTYLHNHLFNTNPSITLDGTSVYKNKKRVKGQRYILSSSILADISKQLGDNIEVVSIEPDTIYFTMENQNAKSRKRK